MPNESQSASQPQKLRRKLAADLKAHPPNEAAILLKAMDADIAIEVLTELNPSFAQDILSALPAGDREAIFDSAAPELASQWTRNQAFEPGTIGRFMEPAYAVFRPEMTVGEAIEVMRALIRTAFITYGYVTDPGGKLLGLITMRDLLFAEREVRLGDIMLRDVFAFRPNMVVSQAMKLTLSRHYPVYPVCDEQGQLLGLVRGQAIFEEEAFEITAQAGSMVGVEKEERISTPMLRSFKFRHPWLQLNLLTAFLAGGVVAMFQDTIDRLVILAAFLPVLAGQSGNTGCQALAVTLRGITLGEIKRGDGRRADRQGRPARCDERSADRHRGGNRDVHYCAGAEIAACAAAGAGGCPGHGRGVHGQRHFRRHCSADAQALWHRSGDGFEHLPDHCDRHREHGHAAWPGHDPGALNNAECRAMMRR